MTVEIHLYGQSLSNIFSNQNKFAANIKKEGAPKRLFKQCRFTGLYLEKPQDIDRLTN